MTDLERILPLWRELETAEVDYVLATVVAVEGPSYRKPGARMLLAPDGRRAGTVSGGCLEAEVAKRAWWLTAQGPVVERYSTAEDEGDRPYGSGCGGVVYLLLERRLTAGPLLAALQPAFDKRVPLAIATVLEGPGIGQRAFAGTTASSAAPEVSPSPEDGQLDFTLRGLAEQSLEQRTPMEERIPIDGSLARVWVDYCLARPGLWIFGAGDDAIPLHRLARELGWFVAVADGRSNLARRERFPVANQVCVLAAAGLPRSNLSSISTSDAQLALFGLNSTDAAVVMAHSFEQDARVLATLLALDVPPAYIGVLGPQRRTRELLVEASRLLGLPGEEQQVERWLASVHAPMGLDLGGEAPAAVALSVLAEIQKSSTSATGLPLHQVRAASRAMSL
jgi:xanthine/CO dehydrogenase XdhC/CoxF family maturation factor